MRILLVDDHPIVRQGLTELINRQPHLTVCGEAEDCAEALVRVAALAPDLAVIDLTLKHGSGLELIRILKAEHPRLPLLALSMHDESLYAERALRAGARGYIMKQEASHKILAALHTVLAGDLFVSDSIKTKILKGLVDGRPPRAAVERLSNRELEVFQLIGHGFSTRQIARRLSLSVKTIESYRESLKLKLQVPGGPELLQQAIQWCRTAAPLA